MGQRYIENMKAYAKKLTLKKQPVSISFGYSIMTAIDQDFNNKIHEADEMMYKVKERHYIYNSRNLNKV